MPALDRLWRARIAEAEPYYEAVFGIIGNGGSILPLVGPGADGAPNATSFTTRQRHASGIEAVFTWDAALAAAEFDPTDPAFYKGVAPVLTFDASTNQADTPDNAYWTVDDAGGANGFSMGLWVKVTDTGNHRYLLSKWDSNVAIQEWIFRIDTVDKLELGVRDDSTDVNPSRLADAAIPMGRWIFVTAVYNGAGGASAMAGATLYVDGAAIASTANEDASYVGMEDGTAVVALGAADTSGTPIRLFEGQMAGGPFGPFHVDDKELTAAEVKRLYHLARTAMGLAA